jgi:hypothetical protein
VHPGNHFTSAASGLKHLFSTKGVLDRLFCHASLYRIKKHKLAVLTLRITLIKIDRMIGATSL